MTYDERLEDLRAGGRVRVLPSRLLMLHFARRASAGLAPTPTPKGWKRWLVSLAGAVWRSR